MANKTNPATLVEKKRRINQAVKLMVSGFTAFSYLEDLASKQQWGIGERQLRTYYKWAKEQIKNNGAFFDDMDDVTQMSFNMLMDIYQEATRTKDNEMKLKVVKEINKMYKVEDSKHFAAKDDKKKRKHAASVDDILNEVRRKREE